MTTKDSKDYGIAVDPAQDDKATEIKFFSTRRPHMRAFHTSWVSFFFAFFAWFCIAPLMPVIKKDLGLDKDQVNASNICAIAATVAMRFLAGPLCDIFGPRVLMAIVLVLGSIPVFLIGTVTSFAGLCTVRFFIGIIGASFVMCQYWTSMMFAKNTVGRANAWSAGWGNLGGGVTQLFMGSAMWPLFNNIFFPNNTGLAWRTIFIVPATMTMAVGFMTYFAADDSPYGNYKELKKQGVLKPFFALPAFLKAFANPNTLILFAQYAASFGVELTFFNVCATYFNKKFDLGVEESAAIAGIFGFFNVISRPFGGYFSDVLNRWFGFRGRLMAQIFILLVGGGLIILFSTIDKLDNAIGVLSALAFFMQAANGSCYAIVPYVDRANIGAVSGIVGGGGNMGGLFWGFVFLYTPTSERAFLIIGICVMATSLLTSLISIPGYGMLFWGKDEPQLQRNESRFELIDDASVKSNNSSLRSLPGNDLSAHGLDIDEETATARNSPSRVMI